MILQQPTKTVFAVHVNALNADMAILEIGLLDGRAYVAGPEFSIADITIGSLFYRIIDLYPIFSPVSEGDSVAQSHCGTRRL